MRDDFIPFNRPYMTGNELLYITQAHANNSLAGDGDFTRKCSVWLEEKTHAKKVLLTHSCTAALEMAAILANITTGDEVIMPSYTFVSTANAFVLRGAIPVFVDIRPDTLNIDETKIESAITNKTKAIVPVHYAGVACEMDAIMGIAECHDLIVIEDAAQGVMSTYKGRPLGSIGHIGTFSFHETKNIISGEGGAILLNSQEFVKRAEIIREKGTNRSRFFRGEVDKYTWVDIGSSYLPSEIIAAFLWAQIEEAERITNKRLSIWKYYHTLLANLEEKGWIQRPNIPDECEHNAHMYYILLNEKIDREQLLNGLYEAGIHSVFHYVPLHSSPFGERRGKIINALDVTTVSSERVVRLPLWVGLTKEKQERIVKSLYQLLNDIVI